MNKYILNKFITIIKVGLQKYYVKHSILSKKSYVLDFDDNNKQQAMLIDKLSEENEISIDFLNEVKNQNDSMEEIISFLLEESIIVPEYSEDIVQYYSLINTLKTQKGISGKKVLFIVSSLFIKEQLKNNLKNINLKYECILETEYNNVDVEKCSFISIIYETFSPDFFHKFNKIALDNNIPLHISYLDGSTSFISPVFIKNVTVCYNEMEIQIESAFSHKYEYFTYKNCEKKIRTVPPFLLNQLFFYSLHLVFDFFISGKLKTKDRAIIFDLESLRYDLVDILPLPNCPACKSQNKMSHDFL